MPSDLNKLKVLTEISAAFTDQTENAYDYGRDPFPVPLTAGDFLYIGRTKPFNAVYVAETLTPNLVPTSFTAEYFDGTAWQALALPVEDTRAFTRSGFIKFEKPDDWAESPVNSVSRFWVRLTPVVDLTASTSLQGLNIVYADDNDLKKLVFDVKNLLPKDIDDAPALSHILSHVAARDEIIQKLRRDGRFKSDGSGNLLDLDEFDLHKIDQVRQAAVYLALHYIYDNLSDEPDDIYGKKSDKQRGNYNAAINLYLLSVDTNNDGVENLGEQNKTFGQGTLTRG